MLGTARNRVFVDGVVRLMVGSVPTPSIFVFDRSMRGGEDDGVVISARITPFGTTGIKFLARGIQVTPGEPNGNRERVFADGEIYRIRSAPRGALLGPGHQDR